MSLHNLICQFTDGRAKRQSSKEEPEVHRGPWVEVGVSEKRGP